MGFLLAVLADCNTTGYDCRCYGPEQKVRLHTWYLRDLRLHLSLLRTPQSLVSGPYRECTLQPMTFTEEETPGILLKSTQLDGDRNRG